VSGRDELQPHTFRLTRADLVRYAGASGDFNPIHWSDRVASSVGLPGVIAHGMLTMALAGRAVEDWAGGRDRVLEYTVRFSRPVVVPDDDRGVDLEVSGAVKEVTEDGLARIDLTCTCGGEKVLGMARAVVRRDRQPSA
jgi:acyl dehydratase